MTEFRELNDEHLDETRAIFNYYVVNTNATPETEERTSEQHERIVRDFVSAYVACDGGGVVGFAFAKPYQKGMKSFDPAVEIGVYVHHAKLHRGIGSALVRHVLNDRNVLAKHTVIAKLDADNRASIKLLANLGFQECARLHEIGYKRGKRVTVIYMQLIMSGWAAVSQD